MYDKRWENLNVNLAPVVQRAENSIQWTKGIGCSAFHPLD